MGRAPVQEMDWVPVQGMDCSQQLQRLSLTLLGVPGVLGTHARPRR